MFAAQGPDGAHEPGGEPVALDRLEDEITTLAGHLNAATARFLVLVGEYDRRGGWRAWGSKSCADWLSWRCGISPVTAREQLRVARALEDLPLVRAEFAAGRFSYSQTRALTRVATPEVEPDLVEMARHCTAAQLDRLTRGYRKASEQMEEASEAHARRSLDWWEDRGMLVIQARLPVAEGEAVLEAVTRHPRPPPRPGDCRHGTCHERTGDDSAEAPGRGAPGRGESPTMIPRKRRRGRPTRRRWPMRWSRCPSGRFGRVILGCLAPNGTSSWCTSTSRRSSPTPRGGAEP